jgi:hypothetical protein
MPEQKSVPFCRAANGALARRPAQVSSWAMTKLSVISRWIILLRAQRRSREILLAIALTLAAVAFITAAISGAEPRVSMQQVQTENTAPHGAQE